MAVDIIAEGRKFVSCLLFVDFEILDKYKSRFKMKDLTDEQFLNSALINDKIAEVVNLVNDNLDHWEQIRKYHLIKDRISIESGEITPSMKLRRAIVEEKYRKVIEDFYKE